MSFFGWLFGCDDDDQGDVDNEPVYTAADIEQAAIESLQKGPMSARHIRIEGPGTHITTGDVLADMEARGIVRQDDEGHYYLVEEG
jgi:hypothetical protein